MPTNQLKKTVLVVGGAGFIGSHMVLALQEAGYHPLVLDNLSTGHRDAVLDAELIVGEMGDQATLAAIFSTYTISAVMHFASFIEVGESVRLPLKYYQNNVAATLQLLETMLQFKVKKFVFSSTAAVFGEPQYNPIDEVHPRIPINPYGNSKRMVEDVLEDLGNSEGLQFAVLRYFNAAGADPKGRVGERHEPESHLIPLLLQVASGDKPHLTVYGRDYATQDGTCVRDYVHVSDLCDAHLLALEALNAGESQVICNLGTGNGFTVYEVIQAVRRITGHPIPLIEGARRLGDPAILVADSTRAKATLGWQPRYTDLDSMVRHAWEFKKFANSLTSIP